MPFTSLTMFSRVMFPCLPVRARARALYVQNQWQISGRSKRAPAEPNLNNNDDSSGNSEHASDTDAESSNLEAMRDDACASPAAIAVVAAAETTATATATATAKATENATGTAITDARATLLLPLGNQVIVEVEGCSGHGLARGASCAFTGDGNNGGSGDDGDDVGVPATVSSEAARRLVRLDDRVEILRCRGKSIVKGYVR